MDQKANEVIYWQVISLPLSIWLQKNGYVASNQRELLHLSWPGQSDLQEEENVKNIFSPTENQLRVPAKQIN